MTKGFLRKKKYTNRGWGAVRIGDGSLLPHDVNKARNQNWNGRKFPTGEVGNPVYRHAYRTARKGVKIAPPSGDFLGAFFFTRTAGGVI